MMLVPPWATSRSEATPRAGLAVTPLLPSEPPQLVPRMILSAVSGTRLTSLARGSSSATARTPASTVLPMPPHSWMVSTRGLEPSPPPPPPPRSGGEGEPEQALALDEVGGLARLAAEADEDVGGDVGVTCEAGEGAVQLSMVGAVVLHGAAGLVRNRDDAIDVGELFQQVGGAEAL